MAEIRVACWRCKGKCQEFGWAKPGDTKQTWHPCPACQGKGWVMGTVAREAGCVIVERCPPEATPPEDLNVMLQRKMREFFESQGVRFVDITNQVVQELPTEPNHADDTLDIK
jgi:hypothetical protein